jgi:hypothetical protein
MQEGDQSWCYVDGQRGLERRALKLGLSSQSLVQVLEGLSCEERVVLNPMAIVDAPTRTETEPAAGPPLAVAQPPAGR